MAVEQKIKSSREKKTFLQRLESLNPHLLFIYLSIVGSGVIFLFLLVMFNISNSSAVDVSLPEAFLISTATLMASNITVRLSLRHFERENMHKMVITLGITLVLTILFLLSQVIGWEQLVRQGSVLSGKAFESYIFMISGLHFIHVLGATIFLSYLFISYIKASTDPVKALVTVTNPYERVKLKMLITCWNFLDIVWIVILINFLFTL